MPAVEGPDPLVAGDEANTPLEPEERDQLIPTYITLRSELNVAEQTNIAEAERWAFSRRRNVLSLSFLGSLHRRMFGQVWRRAGKYRRTPRNIGVDAYRIPADLAALVNDTSYWIDNHVYPEDEIAVRFSHRLVQIHPFPNGNGRHSRLAADLLAVRLGRPSFTWGARTYRDPDALRRAYVAALRRADEHDMSPLLTFARS